MDKGFKSSDFYSRLRPTPSPAKVDNNEGFNT